MDDGTMWGWKSKFANVFGLELERTGWFGPKGFSLELISYSPQSIPVFGLWIWFCFYDRNQWTELPSDYEILEKWAKTYLIALLNLSVFRFLLVVFHDKAKRTQQGNLLVGVQTCEKYGEVVRMGWKAKAAAFLFPTASLRWSLLINVAHTHTLCILQRAIYYSIFRQEARNRLALLFIYHF